MAILWVFPFFQTPCSGAAPAFFAMKRIIAKNAPFTIFTRISLSSLRTIHGPQETDSLVIVGGIPKMHQMQKTKHLKNCLPWWTHWTLSNSELFRTANQLEADRPVFFLW
jgi:hypothetical protein